MPQTIITKTAPPPILTIATPPPKKPPQITPPPLPIETTTVLEKPVKTMEPLDDMRRLIERVSPSTILHQKIPSDKAAIRIKNTWKEKEMIPDIPILSTGGKGLSFLKNIAKAIDIHFAPSHIVNIDLYEKDNRWDFFLAASNIKLIIIPDTMLWTAKNLQKFHKETPLQNTRMLGNCPLLILPDLTLYFKDPFLKASLWNVLKHSLSPSS